jgi:hypothetical protein
MATRHCNIDESSEISVGEATMRSTQSALSTFSGDGEREVVLEPCRIASANTYHTSSKQGVSCAEVDGCLASATRSRFQCS